MVGLPNRTGRCTICKRMKVKVPQCPSRSKILALCNLSRTVRSFTSGVLKMQTDRSPMQIPCSTAGTGFHQSEKAVDIFSNADKTRVLEISDALPSRTQHNRSLEYSIPKSPDPEPVHRMQLLSKFIDIYFPKVTQGPTRVGQTHASWVHVLPEIAVTNSAYNTSLAALCVLQLGIWNHILSSRKKALICTVLH
jgi:hypothetical protein